MSIWGSSKSVLARLEVGQNAEDLYVRFDVGQNSRELLARFAVRLSASQNLLSKVSVTHSLELGARLIVRPSSSGELYAVCKIRDSASSNLLGKFFIGSSQDLACRMEVRPSGSENLLSKFEVIWLPGSSELLANAEIRQPGSAELLAKFEVGQDSQNLLARFNAGQNSEDLLCKAIILNANSAELLARMDIVLWSDLLSTIRIRQVGAPVWLECIFSIGETNDYADLLAKVGVKRVDSADLTGIFAIQHPASAELLAKAEIRHPNSEELLANSVIRQSSSQELLCKFELLGAADLYVKFAVGRIGDAVIVCDNPSGWINVVMGIGQGFTSMPWVEADTGEKMCGDSSAKLTSNYTPGTFKEIKFGWTGACMRFLDDRREVASDGSAELSARAYIMGGGSGELLNRITVRQLTTVELLGKFEIQDSEDLLCRVNIRHPDSVEVLARLKVRLSAPGIWVLGSQLKAKFTVNQ